MSNIEIRWPTVALVVGVCAAVVAIFAFAGPEERVQLLGILAMLGTAGAAVMRAAFGAPEASKPKRIDVPRDDDDEGPEQSQLGVELEHGGVGKSPVIDGQFGGRADQQEKGEGAADC